VEARQEAVLILVAVEEAEGQWHVVFTMLMLCRLV